MIEDMTSSESSICDSLSSFGTPKKEESKDKGKLKLHLIRCPMLEDDEDSDEEKLIRAPQILDEQIKTKVQKKCPESSTEPKKKSEEPDIDNKQNDKQFGEQG